MSIADKDLGREREHLGGFRASRPRASNRLTRRQLVLNQLTAQPWSKLPYMPSAGFVQRPYWQHVRTCRAIHSKRG